jgi:hypothetical protein
LGNGAYLNAAPLERSGSYGISRGGSHLTKFRDWRASGKNPAPSVKYSAAKRACVSPVPAMPPDCGSATSRKAHASRVPRRILDSVFTRILSAWVSVGRPWSSVASHIARVRRAKPCPSCLYRVISWNNDSHVHRACVTLERKCQCCMGKQGGGI